METAVDNGTIMSKVTEAHELVEGLKKEIFAEEEKKLMRRVVHRLLFYFLITLIVGSIVGFFYTNWQVERRLSMAKRTGILTLSDGSMFELVPMAPKNQVEVVDKK